MTIILGETIVAVICAWCKRTVELKTDCEYGGVEYVESHTACPSCAARVMADYAEENC